MDMESWFSTTPYSLSHNNRTTAEHHKDLVQRVASTKHFSQRTTRQWDTDGS